MVLDGQSLGNILTLLQILGILGGGVWFYAGVKGEIKALSAGHLEFVKKLEKVDNKLESFNGVLIQLAKQEERMTAQDTRLQELSMRIDTMRFIGQTEAAKASRRKA